MARTRPAVCLALNGASLLLAGLLTGAAIPAVPYPRLMLAAHSASFADSGLISMLAAVLPSSSLCSLPPRAASVVVWSHVTLWPLSLRSRWGLLGNDEVPPDRRHPSGAPGQETVVGICHVLPALALMVAWALLAWGVWGVFKRERKRSNIA